MHNSKTKFSQPHFQIFYLLSSHNQVNQHKNSYALNLLILYKFHKKNVKERPNVQKEQS